MATSVQVELIVDEKGAVQGVRTFGASIQGAQVDVNKLDATLTKLNAHLDQLGKGTSNVRRLGAAAHEAGGHFQTSLDKVRLIRQEFGLFMPRAMESMISRSAMLMGIIEKMQFAVIGVGAAMVAWSGVREIIHGVEYLRDNFFSLQKAVDDYNAEVQKAKQEDFGNPHSVETLTLRLREAQGAATTLMELAQTSQNISFFQAVPQLLSGDYSGMVAKMQASGFSQQAEDAQRQADKLKKLRDLEKAHQDNLQRIEIEHAGDESLRGRAHIRAREYEQRERAAEERQYGIAQDKYFGNPVDENSGNAEMAAKDAIAQREADAETYNLNREQAIELRHLREQALEAGLRGEALYRAQEAAAIDALKDKDMDSAAARNAIHEKFHNEEMRRLETEATELQKMRGEAMVSGLSGIAKIRFEGQNRVRQIQSSDKSDAYKAYASALTNTETANQVATTEQQFTDKVKALQDDLANHTAQGFARISAEGQRQIEALRTEFEKMYGADASNPDYAAHVGELNAGTGAINKSTQDQQAELARRNAAETEEIQEQARSKFLSAEKNKTAAIEAEYRMRTRKLEEQLGEQQISYDDYTKRVEAADMEMQAELIEQAQQARQKIASELEGLFSAHPLQALERMGSKLSAEAGAAIIQRMGSRYGAGMQGRGGSIFDRIAGLPHSTTDLHAELPGLHGPHPSAGIFSVGSATIHVGSANILGGGGSASTSALAPAVYQPGGASAMPMGIGEGYSDIGGRGAVSPSFGGAGAGSSVRWAGMPTGASPAPGAGFAGIASNVVSGVGTAKSIAGLLHSGSSAQALIDKAKLPSGLETTNPDLSKGGTSLFGKDSAMSNTLDMAGSGLGLFSAYKTGGFGGAASGAMSGAKLGLMLGGPMGALIGGLGGAALGFFGGGQQARLWWLKQGQPRLLNDQKQYEEGVMDYTSAYMDIEQLKTEAHQTLSKMGFTGSRYYHDHVTGEISKVEGTLNREEKAGRSQFGFQAAQFATGVDYIPRDGAAWLHRGESVYTADRTERVTQSMEGVHALYRAAMQPGGGVRFGGGDRSLTMNVHAIDSKSVAQFFNQHAHHMRAALNGSYGENSGGADAGY